MRGVNRCTYMQHGALQLRRRAPQQQDTTPQQAIAKRAGRPIPVARGTGFALRLTSFFCRLALPLLSTGLGAPSAAASPVLQQCSNQPNAPNAPHAPHAVRVKGCCRGEDTDGACCRRRVSWRTVEKRGELSSPAAAFGRRQRCKGGQAHGNRAGRQAMAPLCRRRGRTTRRLNSFGQQKHRLTVSVSPRAAPALTVQPPWCALRTPSCAPSRRRD